MSIWYPPNDPLVATLPAGEFRFFPSYAALLADFYSNVVPDHPP